MRVEDTLAFSFKKRRFNVGIPTCVIKYMKSVFLHLQHNKKLCLTLHKPHPHHCPLYLDYIELVYTST